MSWLNNFSIDQLLDNLKYYGELIIKIFLLYLIIRISLAILTWLWRTLIVPLFHKRSYFYYYLNDGFYDEERPLGLFRRLRNIRWTIKDKLVGYVERNRGDLDHAFDHAIYLKSHGRNPVGGALYQDGVCKIYLNTHDKEGGLSPDDSHPVGYIDGGKIYKYYADRESWLKNEPLETPEFIGDCECPRSDWFGWKKWKTEGEKADEDVLPYIEEERTEADDRDGFKDSWPFFRRNFYCLKFVLTRQMSNGFSVSDGKTFYALLASKLWRFLHVYPTGWDNKAMAWGYGYCTEDWRNPFKKNDDHGTPTICRAAAALLLARYEGFLLDPDEIPQSEKKGPIPTVLISFCLYLVLFPFFQKIAKYLLFPFMGEMLNTTVVLIALFFVLWLLIVHPIRCLVKERTDTFESFLEKLNLNVGVTGWMLFLVIVSILGIIASIFWIGYEYFPIYVCALTTFTLNWAVYNAKRWIVDYFGGSGRTREYYDDDRTEGRRKKQDKVHKSKDKSGEEGGTAKLGKDEDCDDGVEKTHEASLNTPTGQYHFKETLYFNLEKLKELRIQNPSRKNMWGSEANTVEERYARTAAGMVQQEVGTDNSQVEIYSKVKRMAELIKAFVKKKKMSNLEEIQLIMTIFHMPNIDYKSEEDCEELMIEGHNGGLLTETKDRYKEYCRYPTETLFDKRGDCDCHAALAGALFAACGYGCCYLVGNTASGAHAALGLEITDSLKALRQYKEAIFSKGDKEYLYVETTGNSMLGQMPGGFEEMKNGGHYPIEPIA